MKNTLTTFFLLFSLLSQAQEKPKWSIEVSFGLAGSPGVQSYTERGQEGYLPDGITFLADKNYIGTVGQFQINYFLKNGTSLSVGFARDNHEKERNYRNTFNGVPLIIDNWSIRHNNNIYFFKHKRHLSEQLKYHFGVFYLRPEQQEIEIYESPGFIDIDERDQPNNRLNEAGLLAGIDYEKQLDTNFVGGLHLTGYYLASASTYETTYLTGSIAYTIF